MKKMKILLCLFFIFEFINLFHVRNVIARCHPDCADGYVCDEDSNTCKLAGVHIGEDFKIGGNKGIGEATGYDSIGTFLSTAIIPNVMVVANIILFIMIFASGFTVISSAGNPDKNKNAKATLTASVIGFVIIFAAYWIMEALGIIMGYNPLGGS